MFLSQGVGIAPIRERCGGVEKIVNKRLKFLKSSEMKCVYVTTIFYFCFGRSFNNLENSC